MIWGRQIRLEGLKDVHFRGLRWSARRAPSATIHTCIGVMSVSIVPMLSGLNSLSEHLCRGYRHYPEAQQV